MGIRLRLLIISFAALSALVPWSDALALEDILGKVTVVEATYMPGRISFEMDTGSASCAAGTWLTWTNVDPSNVKATYASLMVALIANTRVHLYVNSGDTTCKGQFIHFLSQ